MHLSKAHKRWGVIFWRASRNISICQDTCPGHLLLKGLPQNRSALPHIYGQAAAPCTSCISLRFFPPKSGRGPGLSRLLSCGQLDRDSIPKEESHDFAVACGNPFPMLRHLPESAPATSGILVYRFSMLWLSRQSETLVHRSSSARHIHRSALGHALLHWFAQRRISVIAFPHPTPVAFAPVW